MVVARHASKPFSWHHTLLLADLRLCSYFTHRPGTCRSNVFSVSLSQLFVCAYVFTWMSLYLSRRGRTAAMKAWPYRRECRGHDPAKKESVALMRLALLANCALTHC